MEQASSRSVGTRVWRWMACLLMGMPAAAAYASLFDDVWHWTAAQLAFNAFYFTAVFTGLAYPWLFRLVWPRLTRCTRNVRWLWAIGALLTGVVLTVALGGTPQPAMLEVVATGQHNPAAQAGQVWLLAAHWSDGTSIPLSDFQRSVSWEEKPGAWGAWSEALASLQGQPAVLRWSGQTRGELTLTFVAHPWSGVALVRWGGKEQLLDLYSAYGTERTLTLSGAQGGVSSLAVGLFVARSLSLGMLVLGMGIWLAAGLKRGGQRLLSPAKATWPISGMVGLCIAVSLDNFLMRVWALPSAARLAVVVGMSLIFGYVAHFVVFKLAWPRLASFSRRARLWWCMGALLAAGLLIAAVPVAFYSPVARSVEILATGQKNAASDGTQVWVHSITIGGTSIPLAKLEQIGPWRAEGNMLLCDAEQPAMLKWVGLTDGGDLRITFASHGRAGTALVRWRDNEQLIDLYSAGGGPNLKEVVVPDGTGIGDILALGGLYLAGAIGLGAGLLAVLAWLVTRPEASRETRVSSWSWLYYALPSLTIWSLWLLAFWPGFMNADNMDQWQQLLRGEYNDWHPVIHTLTMWLLTRVWLSPGAVAVFQVLILSLLVGWGVSLFERCGLPRAGCWTISILFALSPANSGMVIYLTKDTLYSVAFLAFTLLVLGIVVSSGRWLERSLGLLVLGGTAALVALYRHNGPVPAFGTLLALLIAYRAQWRRVGLALLVGLGIWLGVRGPLYGVLGVGSQSGDATGGIWTTIVIHHIAAHVAQGTPLTEAERKLVLEIDPEAEIWPYDCTDVLPILYRHTFNVDAMRAHSLELLQLWWALLLRRPQVSIDHLICTSSGVWRISTPPFGRYDTVPVWWADDGQLRTMDIRFPHLGLERQPFLPFLTTPLAMWISRSRAADLVWLLWRPALWLYLGILGAVVAWLRSQRWQYVLVVLPVILNSLIMASYSFKIFRYQYPVYAVGLLVSWFLLLGVPMVRRQDHTP